MVVAHAFNPSIREAKVGKSEFKVSLVYVMTSRTTQISPVSRNYTTNKKLVWRWIW